MQRPRWVQTPIAPRVMARGDMVYTEYKIPALFPAKSRFRDTSRTFSSSGFQHECIIRGSVNDPGPTADNSYVRKITLYPVKLPADLPVLTA
ncbi:hypothetical protein ACVILI_004332 [Mesorhizobium sp. USDA 4775]